MLSHHGTKRKTIYLPELLEDECREKVASGRNDNEKIHKGVKLQRSMPQVQKLKVPGFKPAHREVFPSAPPSTGDSKFT